MTAPPEYPADMLEDLLGVVGASLFDDTSPADMTRLEQLVCNDDRACELYVQAIFDSLVLRKWSSVDAQDVEIGEAQNVHMDYLGDLTPVATSNPVPGILGTTLHGTVGYFSSSWPLAYLLATVILGVGLLIGSRIYVSDPEQVVQQSVPLPTIHYPLPTTHSTVGRITGMVDCQWEKRGTDPIGAKHPQGRSGQWGLSPFSPRSPAQSLPSPSARGAGGEGTLKLQSPVHLHDRFALASGLMEITYDTGARVILQGPCTYETESNGGYLTVGKLTGKLEKSDKRGTPNAEVSVSNSSFILHPSSFVIRTPTVIVTDLGTEFGVEVDKSGSTTSHVFQGKVVLETLGPKASTPRKIELTEGESASVGPQGSLTRCSGRQPQDGPNTFTFVRSLTCPSSLIAYWPMDEKRGRITYDRTRNHINGYLVGGGGWTNGRFGGAVNFSESGQHVYCLTDLKLSLGTGDFTYSLWFKGTEVGGWRRLISHNTAGWSNNSLAIATASNKLRVSISSSDGEWFTDVIGTPGAGLAYAFNDTDWYHVAVTRSGTVVKVYVNGVQVGTGTSSASIGLDNGIYLGSPEGSSFNGSLDDVAVWNQALTASQIGVLAAGSATPLTVLLLDIEPSQRNKNDDNNKLSGDRGIHDDNGTQPAN